MVVLERSKSYKTDSESSLIDENHKANPLELFFKLVLKHNLQIRRHQSKILVSCPVMYCPTPFPKKFFSLALECYQPLWNKVFIETMLPKAVKMALGLRGDQFTLNLAKCHVKQPFEMCILRSDYMLHQESEEKEEASADCAPSLLQLRQVELNTMSVSLAGLSQSLCNLYTELSIITGDNERYTVPPNTCLDNICHAFHLAQQLYLNTYGVQVKSTGIAMIVQKEELNVKDQEKWFDRMADEHMQSSNLVRLELGDLQESNFVKDDKNRLRLLVPLKSAGEGFLEVSVVYFRAGYTPRDYPTEHEWKMRHLLEQSIAIKLPSIAGQLAGMKLMQLALSGNGDSSLDYPSDGPLRPCFAQFRSGIDALGMTQDQLKSWVLKPQREGGGNNVYGKVIAEYAKEHASTLSDCILMEMLNPPKTKGTVVIDKGQLIEYEKCISELGIYSSILYNAQQGTFLHSSVDGYLLRTKPFGVNEGGVVHGASALDCPHLIL